MNRKLSLLEKVERSRKRLLDLARAEASAAELEREEARQESVRQNSQQQSLLESAGPRLGRAPSGVDLLRFDAERLLAQHLTSSAEAELQERSAELDQRQNCVRMRARALKTTEEGIRRTQEESDKRDRRMEQSASDDLACGRWRNAA